ncbi:MAG: phosphoribosylformylglycinamidine synthase subunit PurS [Acidimicrobiia bacterium]
MKVTVHITRRAEIADPQGVTVARALRDLGYQEVGEVRVDRVVALDVQGKDPAEVHQRVTEMCERLLASPVLEDFRVEVAE